MSKSFTSVWRILLFIFVVGFVGASLVSAETDTVHLRHWQGGGAENNERVLRPLFDKFEAENPGIKVTLTTIPWGYWSEQHTAAFVSGDPPELTYMIDLYPTYAKTGYLTALDELGVYEEVEDWFYPQTTEYCTLDGHVWGVPWVAAVASFIWNKDRFREVGLDPNVPPDTWDQMVEFGKMLTQDTDGDGLVDRWGLITGLYGPPHVTGYFLLQAGGKWVSPDTTKASGYLDSPESIQGLEFIRDLFLKYQITVPALRLGGSLPAQGEVVITMLVEGEAAMSAESGAGQIKVYQTEAEKRGITPLDFGCSPRPKGPAPEPEGRAAYGGYGMLSISKATPYKEEAWKLIKFLSRPDSYKQAMEGFGLMSVQVPSRVILYEDDPLMSAANETVKYAYPWPLFDGLPKLWDSFEEAVGYVVREQKTPAQALHDAAQEVDSFLSR